VARLLIASVALLLFAPLAGVRRPAGRDLALIAVCGLSGMTAYQLLLNLGERSVPAGTASLLIASAPIYSLLLAVLFLGEQPSRRRVIGSAIAFTGCAVIAVGHGGLHIQTAALIVLAAALAQGIYHAAHKPLLARYTGFEVTCYAMWSGTIFILPWSGSLIRTLPHLHGEVIAPAIFLGIGPSAIGFATWAYALARVEVSAGAAALYLVPPVAILIAYVWLGELPTMFALVGGVVALGGVIYTGTTKRPTRGGDAVRVRAGRVDGDAREVRRGR
jgi:drug/metabolite transporter (DMT)-like permease